MPFGGWNQCHVLRALLDAGFAVITPKTRADGSTYWDTNIAPFASDWTSSDDHHLMLSIFEGIAVGRFGPLDPGHWYATGISSGGYMTSRMAVSYSGKFRALAIASASYATCAGAYCPVPAMLPADHPPTLFLHGEQDSTVPISTMRSYRDGLEAQHIENRVVTDPNVGHAWLDVAPAEVLAWFAGH
jgi:poly(3-hydroxybutyrate) depolymerase